MDVVLGYGALTLGKSKLLGFIFQFLGHVHVGCKMHNEECQLGFCLFYPILEDDDMMHFFLPKIEAGSKGRSYHG